MNDHADLIARLRECWGSVDKQQAADALEAQAAELERLRAALAAQPADKGPWTVSADGRRIESDDFTHDVALTVGGDFYDDAQRLAYSQALAARLNAPQPPAQPQQARDDALAALRNLLACHDEDIGMDEWPDDASVGSETINGHTRPTKLTFGILRRARAVLAAAKGQ